MEARMKASTWLVRYWAALAFGHGALAMMALHIGLVVALGGSPITPELYGPAVYAVPAVYWVAAQITGAGVSICGALIGGRRGAWLLVAGGCISIPFFALLAAASSMAGQGIIVNAGAVWLVLPFSIISTIAGVGGLKGGR
jgi:hypothetical protein